MATPTQPSPFTSRSQNPATAPPKRPKRNKDRTPLLNSKFSASASSVSEQELLTFYGLTTLEPMSWNETETAGGSQTSMSSISRPPPMVSYLPAQEGVDPLGIKPNVFRDLPPDAVREKVSVFSKQFQPDVFLAWVHPSLSFKQFEEGLSKLGVQGELQHEVMRKLVRENFTAHIVAKTTVDTVFSQMRQNELATNEFQTLPFTETMEIGATTASQVFGPILSKRAQTEKIKATLMVLERFKFFFNLPSTLNGAVQQGHLDIAVRDFKKGRALVQSVYPSLLGESSTPDSIPQQQKKLFEKIWTSVSHVMQFVKENLFKQLNEHELSFEIQEQAIQLILEMDPGSDPIWVYLESRFKWILSQLKEKLSMQFRAMNNDSNGQASTTKFNSTQFRKAILLRSKKEFEALFAKDPELVVWQSLTQLVRVLSDGVVALLPDFAKMVRNYDTPGGSSSGGGGGKKAGGGGRRPVDPKRVELCQRMPYEIAVHYATLLRHALHLAPQAGLPVLPPLSNVNALTVAHFAPKIAQTFLHALDQLQGLQLPRDATDVFEHLHKEVQAKLMQLLLSAWTEDARLLPTMEEWHVTDTTMSSLIALYGSYMKYMMQSAFKVWYVPGSTEQYVEVIFPHVFTSVQVFLEALHAVFPSAEDRSTLIFLNHLDQLLTMAHHWITLLTNLSGSVVSDGSLIQFIQSHKEDLLRTFVRRQVDVLDPILQRGLGVQDWSALGAPKELRPWVFQVLMHFNSLNVLLSTLLPDLECQVLPQVILALGQSMLSMLRKLEHCTANAWGQLTLELSFLQHSLKHYATPALTSLFESMHGAISGFPNVSSIDALLQETLKATEMQFYCFACEKKEEST